MGKKLLGPIYVHNSALSDIPEELVNVLEKISAALKIKNSEWNTEYGGKSCNHASSSIRRGWPLE